MMGQKKMAVGYLRRRAVLVLLAMVVALMLSSGVALAEISVGTDSPETLTGTNSADHITGKGGNDTLRGLAANDTYHFDDGWGADTLTETAFVKVGKKKKPGGIDTLNFSRVSGGNLNIHIVPQWSSLPGSNDVSGPNGESVDLGTSPVENVVGGSGSDAIRGGSAKNTYSGGPGGSDSLGDYGGLDGSGPFPTLVASDDTYKGFTSATGGDYVIDYGGTRDVLDLRPLESSEVYFDAVDYDGIGGTNESLSIVISDTTLVSVVGHFAPLENIGQQNGRMEQIIFSNEVVTNAASMV